MNSPRRVSLWLFSIGLAGLGVLGLVFGDFAMEWQPVDAWVPGRRVLAYCAALLMLLLAPALHLRASAKWAGRVLFAYVAMWLLLKVPALCVAPKMEAVWLGFGEIAVLFAGAWVININLGGMSPRSLRWACMLFGAALVPVGLSHLVYPKPSIALVPAWLPFAPLWAALTGIGQMLCGIAVLTGVRPKLAAAVEAGMISSFALLVWGPRVMTHPNVRVNWTAFWITWIIAAAAWCVAAGLRRAQTPATVAEETRQPAVVK